MRVTCLAKKVALTAAVKAVIFYSYDYESMRVTCLAKKGSIV